MKEPQKNCEMNPGLTASWPPKSHLYLVKPDFYTPSGCFIFLRTYKSLSENLVFVHWVTENQGAVADSSTGGPSELQPLHSPCVCGLSPTDWAWPQGISKLARCLRSGRSLAVAML